MKVMWQRVDKITGQRSQLVGASLLKSYGYFLTACRFLCPSLVGFPICESQLIGGQNWYLFSRSFGGCHPQHIRVNFPCLDDGDRNPPKNAPGCSSRGIGYDSDAFRCFDPPKAAKIADAVHGYLGGGVNWLSPYPKPKSRGDRGGSWECGSPASSRQTPPIYPARCRKRAKDTEGRQAACG